MRFVLAMSLLLGQTSALETTGEKVGGAGIRWEERVSPEDRIKLASFGECVAKAHPKQVQEAVLGWPTNPKSVKVLFKIDYSDCLKRINSDGREVRVQPGLMRYILADALARLHAGALDLSAVGQKPPLAHPATDEASYAPAPGEIFSEEQRRSKTELRASFENYVALSRLGECVVRADAANAGALTLSEPGSSREELSFEAVRPALEACAAGFLIRGDWVAIRGEIGTALLRLGGSATLQISSRDN